MGDEAGGQQKHIISVLGVNWGTTVTGILLGMRRSPHGVLGTVRNEVISPASFCRDCLCRFDNSSPAHRACWLWSAEQKGLRRLSLATLPGLPSSLPLARSPQSTCLYPKGSCGDCAKYRTNRRLESTPRVHQGSIQLAG